MKIWKSTEPRDDKFIVISGDTIYKGNPRAEEIENVASELKSLSTIPKSFIGIPFHYMKEIKMQEGKNYIEILFGGDSSEQLIIANPSIKQEIFDHFKSTIPKTNYSYKKLTAFQAGKKPLIAATVVMAIFLWTLYIAIGIESGIDYDVTGKKYNSIAGIVLAIASLGVLKVVMIFGSLLLIAGYSFIRKTKPLPEFHNLVILR